MAFCGIPGFSTMGLASGLVVAACVAVTITLVPAALALLGTRVFSRRHRRAAVLPTDSFNSPRAERWTRRVTRRPAVSLVAGVLLLLALSAPALSLRLGESDAGAERPGTATRVAYDLVSEGFGPGMNGPLIVVAGTGSGVDPGVLAQQLRTTPGVADVTPVVRGSAGTAVFNVLPTTGPQDAATAALAQRLRNQLPPDTDLTGPTATVQDMTNRIASRVGWVIAVVLGATFALLMLLFRSVLIPLKAVLGNLLSVGAAFGVLTLAVQTDAGAQLVGLPGPVPIAAWEPLVLFAILFGLSMDYEVFLMSAVRERHNAGADDRTAVIDGMAGTARIITSAAAIMIAVAVGFALDPSVMVTIFDVGMAVAILIDVTVVRMILVPAALALLGRANWWWPFPARASAASSAAAPALPRHVVPEDAKAVLVGR